MDKGKKNLIQIKFREKKTTKNNQTKPPYKQTKNPANMWKSVVSRTVKGDIKAATRQNDMGIDAKDMKGKAFRFRF